MELAILTPTFNHPEHLRNLYYTLKAQDDKDFHWVIVNDGSMPETDKVINDFLLEKVIDIRYIYQDNAGKSAAVNHGLDKIKDCDFVLICDDDELLNSNAVTTIKHYYYTYKDKCACISFMRSDKKGKPIANYELRGDEVMSFQKRISLNKFCDGYIGYFLKELAETRFPLFKGEKYIGPSVLIMLACKRNAMLWVDSVLGSTEYLDGGITKQGKKLRIRNPKGMIYRAMLMMHSDSSFKVKFGYSVHAYAYKYIGNLSKEDLLDENIFMNAFYPVKIVGWILAKKWKRLYR